MTTGFPREGDAPGLDRSLSLTQQSREVFSSTLNPPDCRLKTVPPTFCPCARVRGALWGEVRGLSRQVAQSKPSELCRDRGVALLSPPRRDTSPVPPIVAFGGCPRLWSAPAQETVFRFALSSQAPWPVPWCQNYWYSKWTATKSFLQGEVRETIPGRKVAGSVSFLSQFSSHRCTEMSSGSPRAHSNPSHLSPPLRLFPLPYSPGPFVPLPGSGLVAAPGCAPGSSHHLG